MACHIPPDRCTVGSSSHTCAPSSPFPSFSPFFVVCFAWFWSSSWVVRYSTSFSDLASGACKAKFTPSTCVFPPFSRVLRTEVAPNGCGAPLHGPGAAWTCAMASVDASSTTILFGYVSKNPTNHPHRIGSLFHPERFERGSRALPLNLPKKGIQNPPVLGAQPGRVVLCGPRQNDLAFGVPSSLNCRW